MRWDESKENGMIWALCFVPRAGAKSYTHTQEGARRMAHNHRLLPTMTNAAMAPIAGWGRRLYNFASFVPTGDRKRNRKETREKRRKKIKEGVKRWSSNFRNHSIFVVVVVVVIHSNLRLGSWCSWIFFIAAISMGATWPTICRRTSCWPPLEGVETLWLGTSRVICGPHR